MLYSAPNTLIAEHSLSCIFRGTMRDEMESAGRHPGYHGWLAGPGCHAPRASRPRLCARGAPFTVIPGVGTTPPRARVTAYLTRVAAATRPLARATSGATRGRRLALLVPHSFPPRPANWFLCAGVSQQPTRPLRGCEARPWPHRPAPPCPCPAQCWRASWASRQPSAPPRLPPRRACRRWAAQHRRTVKAPYAAWRMTGASSGRSLSIASRCSPPRAGRRARSTWLLRRLGVGPDVRYAVTRARWGVVPRPRTTATWRARGAAHPGHHGRGRGPGCGYHGPGWRA